MTNSIVQTVPGLHLNNPQRPAKENLVHTPGNIAVWILIYAELSEFALFFIIFLIAKAHNPEVFAAGPARLNTLAGMLNTLILLTSSFFVAMAISAIKNNRRKNCTKWLWLTLLSGASYCAVKAWEYYTNEAAGITIRTDLFYSLYYYLTFNHALHVLIGMCTILWVTLRTHFDTYSVEDHEGLESAAMYWHMIDLAWIIIFPLLYIL